MFSLEKQKVKLSSVNPRAELHGDDKKLAVDLKFEFKTSNDILSEFHPQLKSSFYMKGDSAQGELIETPGHLPAIKFPLISSFSWGAEYPGYSLLVDYGIDDKSAIHMIDCEVDNFKFTLMDGGSVSVVFRVIAHPAEADLGKLCGMIQQEATITVTPPDSEADLMAA